MDSIAKMLFKNFMYKSQRFYLIMILIMETLLHNVYKPYLRLPNLTCFFCCVNFFYKLLRKKRSYMVKIGKQDTFKKYYLLNI